ncbi:MAG TPA: pseudouridine synthase [Tepidisphaeraceae bacterium]|nr:pseudouridine synthase [Tepidisphaeraceae bacterium]
MKQRIQKVLAAAGVASRRAVEQMVLAGRVEVNGHIITRLPILIDPAIDRVIVDGEGIRLLPSRRRKARSGGEAEPAEETQGGRVYFLLNKPKGVYCTNVAQGAQVRAIDLLPANVRQRVFPVGRLDADSKGLLLLTNDGELTQHLTHPRYGVPKTYRAIIDGVLSPKELAEMQSGIWLGDWHGRRGEKAGGAKVRTTKRLGDRSIVEITLREGKNREVRRMLAALGHKVRDLTRISMGPLSLTRLPIGKCRPLTPAELRALRGMMRHRQDSLKTEN